MNSTKLKKGDIVKIKDLTADTKTRFYPDGIPQAMLDFSGQRLMLVNSKEPYYGVGVLSDQTDNSLNWSRDLFEEVLLYNEYVCNTVNLLVLPKEQLFVISGTEIVPVEVKEVTLLAIGKNRVLLTTENKECHSVEIDASAIGTTIFRRKEAAEYYLKNRSGGRKNDD